ncbi:MAG TPA: TIGR01777 family oxidoreductase [Candidatus Krumholzibacteria bacterium]|nr:TIGR01777 family oxidoreductase [Candidatus Krumholzibacteria bacterium]
MRVFVTGGSGLVGRALIQHLVARGDDVACVTRDPARARGVLPGGVELVGADPTQPGGWQDRLAACDAVVNLAGESVGQGRWTAARKRRIRRSRLAVTDHVASAVAGAGHALTLVSASATGYYGDGGDRPLAEDAQPGQDFLARLAVEWENTARNAERDEVRVVLLRLGMVLARDGGALPAMLRPFRLGLGGPLGSGRQYLPWIHLDDVVGAILFALDHPELHGPVNAVAPNPPVQADFARTLGRVIGKPAFLPAPVPALRIMLGEQADLLLKGQRALPNALRAHGYKFRYPDLEPALRSLLG